jgi:transposase
MMGKGKRLQGKMFYVGLTLSDRIPQEHPLRRIKALVDFGFVRRRVAGRYGYNGNVSLDPALVLKLMFLLFYESVRSERELMRTLGYRLDWLWFCDLDLDEAIPDHSVLSKARRRWGLKVFEEVFAEVLRVCVEAGLVDGQTAYVDSTVLRANASLASRIPRRLWEQLEGALGRDGEAGGQPEGGEDSDRRGPPDPDTQAAELPPPPAGPFNARTVSRTDPDSATTTRRGAPTVLGYRDHSVVDGRCGVVVATVATSADYDDGAMLETVLAKQRQYTGRGPKRVVGDSAYGTRANLKRMRDLGITPYLKRRASKADRRGWLERLAEECDPRVAQALMRRRLHTAEGRFAEAHVRYNHRRCRWRRRWRVQIQCYLVGIVQNVGKLLRWARRAGRPAGSTALAEPVLAVWVYWGDLLGCFRASREALPRASAGLNPI